MINRVIIFIFSFLCFFFISFQMCRFSSICMSYPKVTYASISLACEFLTTVLRILSRTFARHSCKCRTSVVRIFMCRKLVVKVLNMFKNFMRFFCQNISQDCRATFVRVSRTCASVTRQLRDSLEKTCKNLVTIWRENKTKATFVRMLCDTRTNVARLSYELK